MKFLDRIIPQYEEIVLNKVKVYFLYKKMNLITGGAFVLMVLFTYLVGLLFNALGSLGYLMIMVNLIVLSTFVLHKVLEERYYRRSTKQEYSIWINIGFETLYLFITTITASMFMLFTILLNYLTIPLAILFGLLFIVSVFVYVKTYNQVTKIVIPSIIQIIFNGIFVALLLYSVTVFIQVSNIFYSVIIVISIMYLLLVIKNYLQIKLVFKIKRYAVVSLGLFIIALSYFFTNAFNYASFYRGEFTFRIMYDTIDGEGEVMPDGITGEVLVYEDQFVVIGEDNVVFYDDDFTQLLSVPNIYDKVYLMDGNLFANKDINSDNQIDLYEFENSSFQLVGPHILLNIEDKVYKDSADNVYVQSDGDVFIKLSTSQVYYRISVQTVQSQNIITQNDTFIVFEDVNPFLAATDTFLEPVKGNIYENIAYHNNHVSFIYSEIFINRNPTLVSPDEEGNRIIYFEETSKYFSDSTDIPVSFELPRLFRIQDFYFFNDNYYLVGHIEYITNDFNHMILVLNDKGELINELVFDGPNVSISEDYIIYGNDEINVIPIDAPTSLQYRIIQGYGVMFFMIIVVTLFSIDRIHLNPRKKMD